ncbi:MAG: efflux RND transporter periplasmic adaptor subunit [Isosphaeraceae bacterium]
MALADLVQTVAQLGLPLASTNSTPRQFIDEFRKLDSGGDIDAILRRLVPEAPSYKQAQAAVERARRDLAEAELNLRYCDITAEIDGVVTRRNVNPGNFVRVAQSIMAIRSVQEIWIDANFKETQLSYLRIGQPVDLYVDMYGEDRVFKGRVSGFTMGTGSTLALLPPQNATGNFVKVVQRLPVRIDLVDGNPEDHPLFIGLSVVPYVRYKETPTGPDAGKLLQEFNASASVMASPKASEPVGTATGPPGSPRVSSSREPARAGTLP